MCIRVSILIMVTHAHNMYTAMSWYSLVFAQVASGRNFSVLEEKKNQNTIGIISDDKSEAFELISFERDQETP